MPNFACSFFVHPFVYSFITKSTTVTFLTFTIPLQPFQLGLGLWFTMEVLYYQLGV